MSTSLKVVSMAAVFCASFSRSAMRLAQAGHPHPLLAGRVLGEHRRARDRRGSAPARAPGGIGRRLGAQASSFMSAVAAVR